MAPPPFKVWQLNCHSYAVSVKQEEIQNRIRADKPDVVLLQETWLRANDQLPAVPGYETFRRDRHADPGGNVGGGLITLLRRCPELAIMGRNPVELHENDRKMEVLQVSFKWCNIHYCVTNVYAPPANDYIFSKDVLDTCCLGSPEGKHVIAGDFNGHHYSWDRLGRPDNRGTVINDWCMTNLMTPANNARQHTFKSFCQRQTKSSPDIALCSLNVVANNWKTLPTVGSDHLPISFCVSDPNPGEWIRPRNKKPVTKYARIIGDEHWEQFNVKALAYLSSHPLKVWKRGKFSETTSDTAAASRRFVAALKIGAKCLPQGCRHDPAPWWDKDIDVAIAERDALEEGAALSEEGHRAWSAGRLQVLKVITTKRQEFWRRRCSELRYSTDPRKVMRTVTSINRAPRPSPTQVLKDRSGRLLQTQTAKARAFQNQYACVSRTPKFPKLPAGASEAEQADHKKNHKVHLKLERSLRKKVNDHCSHVPMDIPQAQALTDVELDVAIRACPIMSAPGRDALTNAMMKKLCPALRAELLTLINLSFQQGVVPKEWRISTIVPIPKPNKDHTVTMSYRPVSLTSVISKLAERVIGGRLRHFLERSGVLSSAQSGFRTGRSSTEPLLLLVGDVRTAFEKRHKTVAALLDLETAFDKVQHARLLNEMRRIGIPAVYVRWVRAFLRDRRALVRFDDTYTRKAVRFSTGVPQGTVLGPLLFLIYINSLSTRLADIGVQLRMGLFADDISLWITAKTLAECEAAIQEGLDLAARWGRAYRMPFSPGSEAILFSNDRADARRVSPLTLAGMALLYKPQVRLLGIVLDSMLTFKPHVAQLLKVCGQRLNQMCTITGRDWGSGVCDLRALYMAYIRSKFLYCASVYFPLLSDSALDLLEIFQRKVARIATGCVYCTQKEVLLLQCNLFPLEVEGNIQTGTMAEKCRRLPEGDPMQIATTDYACASNRLRSRGEGWQLRSDKVLRWALIEPGRKTNQGNLLAEHDNITREPLLLYSCVPPWATHSAHLVTFHSSLIRPCPKDANKGMKKRAAEETLQLRGAFDWEMWTDGTLQVDPVTGRQVAIGGGQIYEGRTKILETCAAGGLLPSSYRAEGVGILASLNHLINTVPADRLSGQSLLICTDSHSQVDALAQGPLDQKSVQNGQMWVAFLQLLDSVGMTKIVVQWVPAHCGLRRNEAVDKYVGRAAAAVSAQQAGAPIPLAAVKAALKAALRDKWHAEIVAKAPLNKHPFPKQADIRVISRLERADATLILQLRAGTCSVVGQFYHIVRGDTDGKCRWCGVSDESVEHLFSKCRAQSVRDLRREFKVKDVKLLGSSNEEELRACVKFVRKAVAILA